MKLGLMLGYSGAELRIPLEDVKLAEQLGYDSVWTAEAYGSDAITPLADIAARTDRTGLGTSVRQLARQMPANAAMAMATLGQLSGGNRVLWHWRIRLKNRRRLVWPALGKTLLPN